MNPGLNADADRLGIKVQIIDICHRLHQRNLLAAADGNVSYRISDNEILITPSGKNKDFITTSEIATMNLEGKTLTGKPSGEALMHLEVYRRCPQAKAIVHAHPPTAIAWTVAKPESTELPVAALSELILALGRVPIAKYARPGTQEMGDTLKSFLPEHRVIMLARHGALSWGEDLMEASNGMERIEHVCQILKSATQFGGLTELPAAEVEKLFSLRKQLGPRSL